MKTKMLYCRVPEETHTRLMTEARERKQSIATVASRKLEGDPDSTELQGQIDALRLSTQRMMDLTVTVIAQQCAHWPEVAADIERACESNPDGDTVAHHVARRMRDAALEATGQTKVS